MRQVALIRGVNVGRAKRVAMADLRALVEELGCSEVRTLLNSGNVVFGTRAPAAKVAARIEKALVAQLGVTARVTVLTAAELAVAVEQNPLLDVADDPSRLLVAVLKDPADRIRLKGLTNESWAPEAVAVGKRVAYLWCPAGVLASRLPEAVGRALGDRVTTRNWSTITKLHAMAQDRR